MRPVTFQQSPLYKLFPYIKFIVITLLILLLLKSFVIDIYSIPTQSMQPTLLPGEHVLSLKAAYGVRIPWIGLYIKFFEPSRGDVVVIKRPEDKTTYIKRIIGIPGDTVDFKANELIISGNKLKKDYFTGTAVYKYIDNNDVVYVEHVGDKSYLVAYSNQKRTADMEKPYSCSSDGYFVAGDNRTNSIDSKRWGEIKRQDISSKVFFVWMSRDPETKQIRWNRIGQVIH